MTIQHHGWDELAAYTRNYMEITDDVTRTPIQCVCDVMAKMDGVYGVESHENPPREPTRDGIYVGGCIIVHAQHHVKWYTIKRAFLAPGVAYHVVYNDLRSRGRRFKILGCWVCAYKS